MPLFSVHVGQTDKVAVLNNSKGESAGKSGVVNGVIQAPEETILGVVGSSL